MESKEIFAKRLVKLRENRGITQQTLADDLMITRQSLSLYEKAERTINIDLLVKIAKYFDVSTDYLLGMTDNATTDADLKAVCEYTGLSEDAITTFIDNMDESIWRCSPNYYPEIKYRIVNKMLLSRDFYHILHNLFNVVTCSTDSLIYSVIYSEYPDLSGTANTAKYDKSYAGICDIFRYKISKQIEKIIDIFDNSIKADNITRNDLINDNDIIKPFEITDKYIDERIKFLELEKDKRQRNTAKSQREQVTNNGQHNPEEE